MNNLLNAILITLSVYHVFTSPIPNDKRLTMEETINTLHTLISNPENIQDKHVTPLYPDEQKKKMTIEELSCRAQNSIEKLNSNDIVSLKRLLEYLTRSGNCTVLAYKKSENSQDLLSFLKEVKNAYQEHYIDLD